MSFPLPPIRLFLTPLDAEEVLLDEAEAFFAAQPDELGDAVSQHGTLVIGDDVDPDSESDPPLAIGGDMSWLIGTFCLDGLSDVAYEHRATLELFDDDTDVTMKRDGDTITLLTEYNDPVSVPTLPFIHAVLDTIDRYAAVANKLWPDGSAETSPPLTERTAYFRDALAEDDGSAKS